jgi:hypothetical protein
VAAIFTDEMRKYMKYQFTINTTASDLWQLSMYGIYGSIVGATNTAFTAAMILLTVRFFSNVHIILKCLLILACCLFPIIQPLLVYIRARKQVKNVPKDVNLGFDDQGIHVNIGDQKSDIDWNNVTGITKKPTLMVIYTSARHGYVLTNKVLGDQKKAFYNYICSKLEKK